MFDVRTQKDRVTLAAYCSQQDDSDQAVADILNAVQDGSEYVVSLGEVTRDAFVGAWADVLDTLRTCPDVAVRDKWAWRMQYLLMPKETLTVNGAFFAALAQELIADGLVTKEQANAKLTRQGSIAESIFGAGTVLAAHDVWMARLEGQK